VAKVMVGVVFVVAGSRMRKRERGKWEHVDVVFVVFVGQIHVGLST